MREAVSQKFIRFARKVLPQRPVICDIGSRDAIEGIYLLRQLGGRSLHVFEPNPRAAELCRRNLAQAMRRSVEFNEVAVSDRRGEMKFYAVDPVLSANKDIGFSSLFRINPEYTRRRGSVVHEELVVSGTTLDDYFIGKEQPDLLWVDVEGAELQVFRGASRVLGGVSLIHTEVSFRPMQISKPLFWDIHEHLTHCGFLFYGFMEISAFRSFLYRHRLLPNLPWRLNAVFYKNRKGAGIGASGVVSSF